MTKNKVILTQDGSSSVFSHKFEENYHSRFGAAQESSHVFIEAGLKHKAKDNSTINILELGLGTGLNVFLTYLESIDNQFVINYTGIEAYPLETTEVAQLNYLDHLNAQAHADVFNKIHTSPWEETVQFSDRFNLIKNKQLFENIDFQQCYNVVYFDAFAPNVQPELWEPIILQKMYDALVSQGVLVTYCAKGNFKRALKEIGFTVEALPGPPGKREMTRATKS